MHVAFRRDRVADPARRAEVAARLGAGAMPVVQQIPGFTSGIVVILGHDEIVCIAIFTDPTGSQSAANHLTTWPPHHLADLLATPGEVATGELWRDPLPLERTGETTSEPTM